MWDGPAYGFSGGTPCAGVSPKEQASKQHCSMVIFSSCLQVPAMVECYALAFLNDVLCGSRSLSQIKSFFFLNSLLATVTDSKLGEKLVPDTVVAIVVTDIVMLFGKIVEVLRTLGWKSHHLKMACSVETWTIVLREQCRL